MTSGSSAARGRKGRGGERHPCSPRRGGRRRKKAAARARAAALRDRSGGPFGPPLRDRAQGAAHGSGRPLRGHPSPRAARWSYRDEAGPASAEAIAGISRRMEAAVSRGCKVCIGSILSRAGDKRVAAGRKARRPRASQRGSARGRRRLPLARARQRALGLQAMRTLPRGKSKYIMKSQQRLREPPAHMALCMAISRK